MRKIIDKLTNEKSAQNPNNFTNPIKSVLTLIGKPFYYLLIITVVVAYYATSRLGRFFLKTKKDLKLTLFRISGYAPKFSHIKNILEKLTSNYLSKNISRIKQVLYKFVKEFEKISLIKKKKKTVQVYPKPKLSELTEILSKLFTPVNLIIKGFLYFLTLLARAFYFLLNSFLSLVQFVFSKILKPLGEKHFAKPPKKKAVKKYKSYKHAVNFKLLIFTLLFFIFFITPVTILKSLTKDLPSPEGLVKRKVSVSTKIYDRNGILLYTIFKDENRTPIKVEDIPLHVKLATLAAEDAEFYDHPGFSVRGIMRATIRNLKEDDLEGGSTITQQLVKNTLLTPERTLKRKIREIVLAIQVEQKYTKDEILEMYLNEVSYGGVAYGIQEAAKIYFGKDVDRLTLGEAALLAGLPRSPTKYSPFGSDPESSFRRQKDVLWLMQVNGYIPETQRLKAEEEKINFSQNRFSIRAPHFVAYVRQILEEKYGANMVEKGGLNVTTSLDFGIQQQMQEIVRQEILSLHNLNVGNGALLVLDPKNGEILAMVGSSDYFDIENQGNVNVTTSLRQPGSSIKIVNYAYALSNGYSAASILEDSPVTYQVDGQEPYTPRNYDNRFRGNLTLRSAFSESRNIPAVKTLESYGVINMIEMGREMGITTWSNPDNYGLSLTLGGGEVKLLDLARVYATVANHGNRPPLTPILSVSNFEGKIIDDRVCVQSDTTEDQETILTKNNDKNPLINESQASTVSAKIVSTEAVGKCETKQVLDARVAFILTDILKDNISRAPAFGSNSQLVIPGHDEVAVKTGTSNSLRDNLTVGYNQDYLVAVWVGNNDNTQMSRIASGLTGASSIWNKAMSTLLSGKESKQWEIPEGTVRLPICPYTGTLYCEGCPIKMEWFLAENAPSKNCSPEWFEQKEEEEENSGTEIIRITTHNNSN
ncbi:transglycosylase domain-containing protein [Candidatus Woesebacteria bacterium]|nr:transglycosylase domain-containing protein [Candidatus Woesebacteria bacterium]